MSTLHIIFLFAGIATFCAGVLLRGSPLCVWLEWAGVCCGDGEDALRDP
jgi:hypothetical protein